MKNIFLSTIIILSFSSCSVWVGSGSTHYNLESKENSNSNKSDAENIETIYAKSLFDGGVNLRESKGIYGNTAIEDERGNKQTIKKEGFRDIDIDIN